MDQITLSDIPFNPLADPRKSEQQGTEKGVTSEWVVTVYQAYEKDIRTFVMAKLYNLEIAKKNHVIRQYGSATSFYKEVKQETLLHLLNHIHNYPQNCMLKHIFWAIRYKFKKMLYRDYPEIHESSIGDDESTRNFLDNCPDEIEDQFETIEQEKRLNSFVSEVKKVPLNDTEQKVIKFNYFQEMDYTAICSKLGLKNDIVLRHHNNAIQKIRTHFVLNQKLAYAN